MKSKFFIGAMIALMAIAACTKEQQPMQNEQSTEGPVSALVVSASTEQPGGTKTSLEGLNVKWTIGDKIYLTDGTNYAIYEATTNAQTTSFNRVSGSGTFAESAEVYAYYPADKVTGFSAGAFTATIPAVQTYTVGGFADGINPMTARATVTSGTLAFNFKNVMAFVKLQIADSDNAGKVLASLSLTSPSANLSGTATVTVAEDGTATTAIATESKTVVLSGINATLSTAAVPTYIAVPACNLGEFTIVAITAESDGNYTQDRTASSALTPARSSINTYNSMQISSYGNRTKIGVPEAAANCYMIDASAKTSIVIPLSQAIDGWDAIKALEPSDTFDKTKIISGNRTIDVRWLDGAGEINLYSINATNMTLALTCTNGTNAVVDLKNGSEIVWSWHLWFTDYKPGADQESTSNGQVHTYTGVAFQPGGLYYGKVMMDRNLGATKTGVSGAISQPKDSIEAQKYFGLFYQFGRKDPFATKGDISVYDASENKKTYAQAAQDPSTFYHIGTTTTPADGAAWCKTDVGASPITDPWNSNSTKSAFDPCPAGWRIPNNGTTFKNNVWYGITTAAWKPGDNSTAGFLWDTTSSSAWLPAAGLRRANGGVVSGFGKGVYIWSASPRVAGAGYYVYFFQGSVDIADSWDGSRAYGFGVRCVKE